MMMLSKAEVSAPPCERDFLRLVGVMNPAVRLGHVNGRTGEMYLKQNDVNQDSEASRLMTSRLAIRWRAISADWPVGVIGQGDTVDVHGRYVSEQATCTTDGEKHTHMHGVDERTLYARASMRLVGAYSFSTFSSARFANDGSTVGHPLPGPEALCHCGCWAEDNFALCHNTAKTTVGISTYFFDPFLWRWSGRALRFFNHNSPGKISGRQRTNFLSNAVLPDGPGGRMIFDSTYLSDVDPTAPAAAVASGAARAAEVVRAATAAVSCNAAALCDVQCAGSAQYLAWKAACANGTAGLDAWTDPPREVDAAAHADASSALAMAAFAWFVTGGICAVAAGYVWSTRRGRGSRRDRAFAQADI